MLIIHSITLYSTAGGEGSFVKRSVSTIKSFQSLLRFNLPSPHSCRHRHHFNPCTTTLIFKLALWKPIFLNCFYYYLSCYYIFLIFIFFHKNNIILYFVTISAVTSLNPPHFLGIVHLNK